MRPLAAALCLGRNDIVLTGEPRMKEAADWPPWLTRCVRGGGAD